MFDIDKAYDNYTRLKKQRNNIIKQTQLKLQQMQKISTKKQQEINSLNTFDSQKVVALVQMLQNMLVNSIDNESRDGQAERRGKVERSQEGGKGRREKSRERGQEYGVEEGHGESGGRDDTGTGSRNMRRVVAERDNNQSSRREGIQQFFRQTTSRLQKQERGTTSHTNIKDFSYKQLYRQKYEPNSKSSTNIKINISNEQRTPPTTTPKQIKRPS